MVDLFTNFKAPNGSNCLEVPILFKISKSRKILRIINKMQVPLANSTSPPLKHVFGPENPEKKRKYRNFRAIDFFESAFLLFNYLNGFIGLTIIIYSCAWSQSPSKILPPLPAFCPHSFTEPQSLYRKNFSFDLHALLRENETDFVQESELLWTKRGLTYGDLQSVHRFTTNVSIPEVSDTHCAPIDSPECS